MNDSERVGVVRRLYDEALQHLKVTGESPTPLLNAVGFLLDRDEKAQARIKKDAVTKNQMASVIHSEFHKDDFPDMKYCAYWPCADVLALLKPE